MTRTKDMTEHELWEWGCEQAKAWDEGKLTEEQMKKLESIDFPLEFYLKEYNQRENKE